MSNPYRPPESMVQQKPYAGTPLVRLKLAEVKINLLMFLVVRPIVFLTVFLGLNLLLDLLVIELDLPGAIAQGGGIISLVLAIIAAAAIQRDRGRADRLPASNHSQVPAD